MNRRARMLAVLGGAVALIAAAAAVVAWHPWRADGGSAAPDETEPPLQFVAISQLEASRLRSIALTSAAGTIELDNVEGAWKIVRPGLLGLKQEPLNDLVYSVTTLSSERVIEERPRDLAPYGLDPPSVTVRVTLDDGTSRELYLGDLTPAGDTYYLMAQGDPRVFTVRAHHGTYFRYGLRDLWAGARAPIDASDVVYVRVRRAGATVLEITRTPDLFRSDIELRTTTLSVVHPWAAAPKPVDLAALTAFAKSFPSLRGEVAVDANTAAPARYGLDAPSAELLMVDGKGNRLHVMAGKIENDALFLQFEGDSTIYAGDPNLLVLLDVDPFRFASKQALVVRIDRIDRLTVSAPGVRHVLEIRRSTPGSEDNAEWLVDGRPVSAKAFKDYYTAAMSMEADAFHDDPVSGAPEVTLEFAMNSGPVRTYTVGFVPYSQEFYAVVKNGKSDILVNRQQVKVVLRWLDDLVKAAGG